MSKSETCVLCKKESRTSLSLCPSCGANKCSASLLKRHGLPLDGVIANAAANLRKMAQPAPVAKAAPTPAEQKAAAARAHAELEEKIQGIADKYRERFGRDRWVSQGEARRAVTSYGPAHELAQQQHRIYAEQHAREREQADAANNVVRNLEAQLAEQVKSAGSVASAMKSAEYRETYNELQLEKQLAGVDKTIAVRIRASVAKTAPVTVSKASLEAKWNALVADYMKKHKCERPTATVAITKTDEGRRLYGEIDAAAIRERTK